MRIGILSDTHNQLQRTQRAVAILQDAGVDGIVHCGDLASAAIVEACAVLPFWFVWGNHDADSVPELQRAAVEFDAVCLGWGAVVEWTGKRVGMVHGHMRSDVRRVLADKPDYVLSGHSHIVRDTIIDGVRWINPGALHRAKTYTIAILDLDSGDLQWLQIQK